MGLTDREKVDVVLLSLVESRAIVSEVFPVNYAVRYKDATVDKVYGPRRHTSQRRQ